MDGPDPRLRHHRSGELTTYSDIHHAGRITAVMTYGPRCGPRSRAFIVILMPWILISLVGGLAVAAIALVVVWRGRSASPPTELKSSEWTALGIVFFSVGLATTPTLGGGMIGLIAVGVIFLMMGIRARDNERE